MDTEDIELKFLPEQKAETPSPLAYSHGILWLEEETFHSLRHPYTHAWALPWSRDEGPHSLPSLVDNKVF